MILEPKRRAEMFGAFFDGVGDKMQISKKGINLIKSFEGCRLASYKCPAGVWTIGYGHTSGVKEGQIITQEQADNYLKSDLEKYEKYVEATGLQLNQNQFDALVSFSYNCGNGNLKTLIKNRSLEQIAEALLLYNKAGGKVLAGLTRRREAERDLFLSGDKWEKKMIINVHAGHNPDGKPACGAIGYIKESTEARRVKDEVIRMLRELGHTVYDCTVEDGLNKNDILEKIVAKCNAHKANLDVSIHFNSAAGLDEDENTTGTEVLVYSGYSKARDEAEAVCKAITSLGFKNRGVKFRPDLYFLKKTVAPAMLVECCFVNDKDDTNLYDYYKMAKAIVKGITGTEYVEEEEDEEVVETPNKDDEKLYHVALKQSDAEKIKETLRELGIDAIIVEE